MKSPEIEPSRNPQESIKDNLYPKEFFDIQLQFAQRVAEIESITIEDALLKYTCLVKRFNCKDSINPDPVWERYIAGIKQNESLLEWTYKFYLESKSRNTISHPEERFGSFVFNYRNGTVEIHTRLQSDEKGRSPLDEEQIEKRKSELKAMFSHIKAVFPDAKKVRGLSWLYNLNQYRRLYPATYGDSRRPEMGSYLGLSVWGQFIDRNMKMRPESANQFLQNLQNQTIVKPEDMFPLKSLRVECPIEEFYKFYGIE